MSVQFQLNSTYATPAINITGMHKVVLTDACHAYVEGPIKIYDKQTTYTMHLYRKNNGSWCGLLGLQGEDQIKTSDVHLRDNSITYNRHLKIARLLPGIISEELRKNPYIEEHRKEAEISRCREQCRRLESSLVDLEKSITEMRLKHNKASSKLFAVMNDEIPSQYNMECADD